MQAVENAIIAAAGLGSRLGLGIPKCLLKIGEVTLLTRMVELLERHIDNIRVVVGYREELVIEHCRIHHPKVIIVRNPEYRTTNTAHSLSLAGKYLRGKTLFLDGDLLVSPKSLTSFLARSMETHVLVGLTNAVTEHAVFVSGSLENEAAMRITSFSRETRSRYEWANVVAGPPDLMNDTSGYVFQKLEQYLPLDGFLLDLAEVDTESDLVHAKEFAKSRRL